MRGPNTSSEKLPVPMMTMRKFSGYASSALRISRPSAKQRRAEGSGGTCPLMKNGITARACLDSRSAAAPSPSDRSRTHAARRRRSLSAQCDCADIRQASASTARCRPAFRRAARQWGLKISRRCRSRGENRKVVEEERIVVVSVENQNHVGLGRHQRVARLSKHQTGRRLRPFLHDARGEKRRMWQPIMRQRFSPRRRPRSLSSP